MVKCEVKEWSVMVGAHGPFLILQVVSSRMRTNQECTWSSILFLCDSCQISSSLGAGTIITHFSQTTIGQNTIQPSATNWITWDAALIAVFNVGRYQTLPNRLRNFYAQQMTSWFYVTEEQALWFTSDQVIKSRPAIVWFLQDLEHFHQQGERLEAPDKPSNRPWCKYREWKWF